MDSPRRLSWHRCACSTLWSCLFRVSFSCQRPRRDRRFLSFTGRAGRGLALSRRNKRRAEERSYDESRDCKFGSHQKTTKLVRMNPNLGHAILFRPVANIAQISYFKNSFVIAARASITFPNIRHLQNIGFAQSASNGSLPRGEYAVSMDVIESPRCSKCGR